MAKEIHKNLSGLRAYDKVNSLASEILQGESYKTIAKTRYVNDKLITDHYAIIPTGQGMSNLNSLSALSIKVYELIARRFLSIFLPPAVYQKFAMCVKVKEERFYANFKVLLEEGYLSAIHYSFKNENAPKKDEGEEIIEKCDDELKQALLSLKKGERVNISNYELKEGETSPPKRYTSGSIILTMENAGQFIEDEELRAQMKGSGIGTSATRAEILKKLVSIEYLDLNKKTQVLTPTLMGEMIYDVVSSSIKPLLDPSLTASWEKGLTLVAEGDISAEEYMNKLTGFVARRTNIVKQLNNQQALYGSFQKAEANYKK